jgi:hypothetical protein
LNQPFPLQLNHYIFFRRHWRTDELGCNWAHGLRFPLLFLWLLFFNWLFLFWIIDFFPVFVYYLFLLDNDDRFWFRRGWLQWCKRFFIGINVE